MKGLIAVIGAGTALFLGGAAHAADQSALAQKDGCLACHTVDKKVVGPAFKDIAKKYAGNKDAEAMLVKKVKDGGSGTWGAIPMPPNGPRVSDADIKTLVQWVLSLK